MRISVILAVLLCTACLARGAVPAVRPATSTVPLITGIFDITTAPALDDPNAPPAAPAKGLGRRAAGYPAAPELLAAPLERLQAPPPRPPPAGALPAPRRGAAGPDGEGPLRDGAALLALNPLAPFAAEAAMDANLEDLDRMMTSAAPQPPHRPQRGATPAPPPRVPLRRRAAGGRRGFPGAAAPAAAAAAAAGSAAAFAASGTRAVHVTSGVLAAYALAPAGGGKDATLAQIRLQDLFAPVGSSNCVDGVYDAHAAFDAAARRFYLAAACGGTAAALLAVSATEEPAGYWYLYSINADGVGTSLECEGGEAAVADYPRLSFNADALALTVRTYCPSAGGGRGAAGAGAALVLLPKGAAAAGEARMAGAVFTSLEIAAAAAAGGAAVAVAPGSVLQLEPAVPQSAEDVNPGHMYFVADLALSRGQARRSFLLVSVVNTGAMWGYNATALSAAAGDDGMTPFVTVAVADRGAAVAAPAVVKLMPQPDGAPPLQAASLPAGIWNGRAAWSGGRVYAIEEAAAADEARTPTLAWTVLEPGLSIRNAPPASCLADAAWGGGYDYSRNASAEFGASMQPAWEKFVRAAVGASGLLDQARYHWGSRRVRPRGFPAALSEASLGGVAAAGETEAAAAAAAAAAADPEAARELEQQLARTDVSPFEVPSKDIPVDGGAGGAVHASGKGYSTYPCARGNKRCTFYGNYYGRTNHARWQCWTCGYGTNGFYVKSKYYTSYQTYNWGYTGLGRTWYAGGWGSGGWGGGYFGGSAHSFAWGAATMNRMNGVGGTGGMGAWWPANTWGGGTWGGRDWVAWGRRRALLQEAGDLSAATAPPAGAAGAPRVDGDAVSAAVIAAQLDAGRATPPVCVASTRACAAAAAARCPRGAEPRATLTPRLVAHGVLPPASSGGLAFAGPSLAVRNGTMLVAATFSGAGKIKGTSALAYPGLATLTIPSTGAAASLRIERRGAAALQQGDVRAAGAWPTPPALALQAGSGAAFLTEEQLPSSYAPAWVSVLDASFD
ncbi:MAG: hypothetical protein J3K34DRAFT_526217 [Monoraphidium minutum]|nr:MAG: hypothetical protein J3K34DRAFT_526217 [Monoraphidium minutum]